MRRTLGCFRGRYEFVSEFIERAKKRADIFDYIEMLYNRTRRHSHLGDVSPKAFGKASNTGP
jgi:hypothetical protein